MARGPRPVVCALAAVLTAGGASAGPIFTSTPQGDWFDGASWSGGTAPAATDAPVIDNGGIANASSDSPLYPAGAAVAAASLAVGSRLDASAPADASGVVALTDVDLVLGGNLWVGSHDSADAGTASGSFGTLGGDQASGSATIAGEVSIGVLNASGTIATGMFYVDGDLEAVRFLDVGVNRGSTGVASGDAGVSGDLRLNAVRLPGAGGAIVSVAIGAGSVEADTLVEETHGFLGVGGDFAALYDPASDRTTLEVGVASGGAHTRGQLDVHQDLLGFQRIDVGVASNFGEPVASGTLRVEGALGAAPGAPGYETLSVGVARQSAFGGAANAVGSARIEHVASPRSVEVGVAEVVHPTSAGNPGSAVGTLEIDSGDLGAVTVGHTSGDSDGFGQLVTGGDMGTVTVGVSQDLARMAGASGPYTTGDAVGSISAGGFATSALVGLVSSDGTAYGELGVEGIRRAGGPLGNVLVGGNGAGAGTAEGRMFVRAGGIDVRRVGVGVTLAAGTATGVLESYGDVTSTSYLMPDAVGYATAQATGHADGTWVVHHGTLDTRRLVVGLSEGAGTATGRLVLDHARVDVDDLTLGDGATVEIQIADLLTYSAIDAGVAKLDGDLEIVLTGAPQNGIYDLVVSGAPDGITGSFDSVSVGARTLIGALAPGQSVSWGIESVPSGDGTVEVFRMQIVPEPASAALTALGLVILAARARRAH